MNNINPLNDIIDWVFNYHLSEEIECEKQNILGINNIKFKFSDDKKYLIGFQLIIKKQNEDNAKQKAKIKSKNISNIISIKSSQFVYALCTGYHGIPKKGGKAPIVPMFTFKFHIKGMLSKLDCSSINDKLLNSNIDRKNNQVIDILCKSYLYKNHELLAETIKILFMIIEDNSKFPSYKKYSSLRNILTHVPPQKKDTITEFNNQFGKNCFEYIKYEPKNNFIMIDTDSKKSQAELDKIISQLNSDIQNYYNINI